MRKHLTWEDLVAEEPPLEWGTSDDTCEAPIPLNEIELPSELKVLLDEKDRIERQLKILSGVEPVKPDDVREQSRFPVKVHTKESRIEDRRMALREEHHRMLKLTTLAKKNAELRNENRHLEVNEFLKKENLQKREIENRRQCERSEYFIQYKHKICLDASMKKRLSERREIALAESAKIKRTENAYLEDRLLMQRKAREDIIIIARKVMKERSIKCRRAQELLVKKRIALKAAEAQFNDNREAAALFLANRRIDEVREKFHESDKRKEDVLRERKRQKREERLRSSLIQRKKIQRASSAEYLDSVQEILGMKRLERSRDAEHAKLKDDRLRTLAAKRSREAREIENKMDTRHRKKFERD